MTSRNLFVTRLYEAELGDAALLADLAHSIRSLAADDGAGRRWSRDKGYKGYTSYASLDDLPRRDPVFADLAAAAGPPCRRASPTSLASTWRASRNSTACGSIF